MKIQGKLFLFAILCSILPLLAAFTLTFEAVEDTLTEAIEENLLNDAKDQLSGLQKTLTQTKQELITLGQLGNMQQVVSGDSSGALQTDIDIFASRTPVFSEILATDTEGFVIASNLHQFIGTNLTGTWEYEAPRLGIHFDGRVVESYRLDRPISTYSVPIYNREAPTEIIGVLIGSINWEYLQKDLSSHNVFGGAQDENRQFILESLEKDKVLYATSGVNLDTKLYKAILASDDADPSSLKRDEIKRVRYGNQQFMMASIWSTETNGFRDPMWRLNVLLDQNIAFAGVNKLKSYFVFTATIVLLLTFVLGMFLARSFVNPVNSLAKGAGLIAKGDYDYVLKDSGNKDEIGELTRSFEAMRIAVGDKQKELESKTALAEQAAQVKGEFLANMSHEVRTPINGVLGMTELLLNTPLDDTQGRYAKTIYRSGQALLSVINDILDFSKIEAGKLELTVSSFDLREMVEDVVEMLAENAAVKGVELLLIMDPGSPVAFNGDSARLRQVLLNLISNAIKFTSKGEVKLVVSFSDAVDGGDVPIKFQIIDTGIGIAEDRQSQIFESFVQADGSTTRQYGGTGLGLAISANLINIMGGEILVKSKLNVGSEFWFEIELPQLSSHIAESWQKSGSLTGKRALIVDDTLTNREILDAQLKFWSATTVLASSGLEAMQRLREAKDDNREFDFIVLDMHMPGMSGTDFAAEVKSNGLAAGAKLVLLSSACDNLNLEDCQALSISALVAKPVRQVELYNVLVASSEQPLYREGSEKSVVSSIEFDTRGGRILLVEDNLVNQEMMCEMLRILGQSVQIAENGQTALDTLAEHSFDLVLMDCQMPVLDGFGATRAIRELENEKSNGYRQPIIALTANAMEGDREKCLDAGMDDYLSKPVSSQQLRDVLNAWLPVKETLSGEAANSDQHSNEFTEEPSIEVMETDSPVLNEKQFSELLAMCSQAPAGFYSTLVDKFQAGTEEDLEKIKLGIEEGNAAQVSSSAHRMKSSSLSIGSQRLSDYCQELEKAAKDDRLGGAEALCSRIEEERQTLLSELRQRDIKAA